MVTKERADEICKSAYQNVFDFCFSYSKNNYDIALEITQEVFLLFLEKLNALEDDRLEHWLISVAKKKCYEYFRRLKNEPALIALEETFTSPEEILSTIAKFQSVSDVDIKLTLEAIKKMLTKDEYDLYIKKFEENKTQAEIAEEMGISVSCVSSRSARLRKKIERLGHFCFTFVGQIVIKLFF